MKTGAQVGSKLNNRLCIIPRNQKIIHIDKNTQKHHALYM